MVIILPAGLRVAMALEQLPESGAHQVRVWCGVVPASECLGRDLE